MISKIARWACARTGLLFGIVSLSLVGCSEIIPGLNVRMDGSGSNAYRIVANDENNGYQVQAASVQNVRYNIIPVDAEVLFNLKTQAPEEFTVSAVTLPSIIPSDVPSEYRIGPGDIVYATVWDHPELSSPYAAAPTADSSVPAFEGRVVAADGTTFYPYLGVIKVVGMTAGGMRDYLTRELAKYIVKPQIDVRVVAYRAKRIEITGEVIKPGTITLDDTPKGILQALDAAGGLTPAASRRTLILIRNGRSYPIDMAGLLSGSRLVPNTSILSGDVIHVPDQSADQVFMLGSVAKQSPVILTQDSMTLIQALTQVGGLDSLKGKQSGVYVFHMHRTEKGLESSIYTLDMSRPDGILLASQFPLSARDVVYVEATEFSKYNSIVTQLLPTVTTIFELHQLTVPN